MVRKVEVVTNWGVQFLGVDSRSVTVETLFKRVLGLTYVLHSAQPARNEINNVSGIACDMTNGLVGGARSMAKKRFRFIDVVLTDNTTGFTLKSTVLGRWGCI